MAVTENPAGRSSNLKVSDSEQVGSQLAKELSGKGFLVTSTEDLINWARTGEPPLDDLWSCVLCRGDDAYFNAEI